MADDKSKRGKPDRSRVNLSESYERRYWCKRIGCTPRELVMAVRLIEERGKDLRSHNPDDIEELLTGVDLFLTGELSVFALAARMHTIRSARKRRKGGGKK